MRWFSALVATLFMLLATMATSAIIDVSGHQYLMYGVVRATATANCGPNVFIRQSPAEFYNEFILDFDASGELFQITEDNLLEGKVIDGIVVERKRNTMHLQYTGLGSPLDNSQLLTNKIKEKAAELGSGLGDAELIVTGYAFKSKVTSKFIALTETVVVSVPEYPRPGCKARIKVQRKVKGNPPVVP